MNDTLNTLPTAEIVAPKRSTLSIVWIIPILAAIIAIGIAVQSHLSKGPTVTIIFQAAAGIEAGKTFVKYKDINIGHVKSIRLSEDYQKIEVTAQIDKHAAGLMVEGTRFWVVQPRITMSGISGIGTLLSGNYIGVEPGKSEQEQHVFVALDTPPVIPDDQLGSAFTLQTDNLGSLGVGTPLYYRQLNVGQVTGYGIDDDGKTITIQIFVHAPYDRFVWDDTRFWHASGVDISLDAGGLAVKTQSLLSLFMGGIAFEEPIGTPRGEPAATASTFTLHDDRLKAFKPIETQIHRYTVSFQESLRGLTVGAPVTFLGLPIGEVTSIQLEYHPTTFGIHPRVEIAIYPDRLTGHLYGGAAMKEHIVSDLDQKNLLQNLVKKGLRAQLQTSNLLSGQLFVAFDYFPNAPQVTVDWTRDLPELPVMAGGIALYEKKLLTILDKFERLPLETLAQELTTALATFNTTLQETRQLVKQIDGEIAPEVRQTLDALQQVLATAQGALAKAETNLLDTDAPLQHELRDMLREVTRAAQSLHHLTEYLERHPESLLRGKTGGNN
ncbi:intermembrane transport protein PqiB [Chrysiogenes arsenatis]|uniref:PqiB family protein n=1 Tax=Chrysiogenes arsenatis TaxID=309797 RepID=UPI00040610B8|nr:MlaD family protein [Chrysiogenes arsenatis]